MIRPAQILLLFVLSLLLQRVPAYAQSPSTFTVKVTGKGQPMLLIPGLSCPGAVWDETVAHYQNRYQCHVVSLAGFGGTPATGASRDSLFLRTVRDELLTYIHQNRLNKPIVVGHSLGGFMALWLASTQPDRIGPLVVVDGLPYFAGIMMPGASPARVRTMADQMRRMVTQASPEQMRTQQAMMMRTMITDPARQQVAAGYMTSSDPATIGQAMYGMYTTDLRADLARITSPTLVLGSWIGYKVVGATRETTLQNFQSQYANLPGARIVLSDTARHFIMWDDPAGFFAETDAFLGTLVVGK